MEWGPEKGRRKDLKGQDELEVMGMFTVLIVVVSKVFTCVKTDIIYPLNVCSSCQLYFRGVPKTKHVIEVLREHFEKKNSPAFILTCVLATTRNFCGFCCHPGAFGILSIVR